MPTGVPFEPGQSGNPAGRPRGVVSIKAKLQKLLNVVIKGEFNQLTEETEDMPVGRKIALNTVLKAVADNDMLAAFPIMEQLDGKPAQALNVGGKDGENPVVTRGQLNVTLVRAKESRDQ